MIEPSNILDLARRVSHDGLTCGDHEDLLAAMGAEGDDANAFLDAYAQEFGVDMSAFLWFFHYNADEPPNFRRVKPVNLAGRKFPLIPITPRLLADAATEGRWLLEYPEHRVRHNLWPAILMFTFLASLMLAITFLFIE